MSEDPTQEVGYSLSKALVKDKTLRTLATESR